MLKKVSASGKAVFSNGSACCMPDLSPKSGQLFSADSQAFLRSSAEPGCLQKQGITPTPSQKTSQTRMDHELEALLNLSLGKLAGEGDSDRPSHQFKISVTQHRHFLPETCSIGGLFTGTSVCRTDITELLLLYPSSPCSSSFAIGI